MHRTLRPTLYVAGLLFAFAAAASCGGDDTQGTSSSSSSSGTGGSGAAGGGGQGGTAGAGGQGGVDIPGLSAPVEAVYDKNGVLHLACAEDDDCFAALGYFHAQNRFFFMDFVRNLVRGKLGSLVKAGGLVLAQDYANRQFYATRQGMPLEDALYQQASAPVRGHLDAYTRGVNAWIGDMRAGKNGATLTTEYDFALIVKDNIRDWEAADSTAVGLYVLNDLSNDSSDEIDNGSWIGGFDPALAADVFSPAPVFDAFTVPAAMAPPPPIPAVAPSALARLAGHRALFADAAATLSRIGGPAGRPKRTGDTGSNNWAVAPSRSASGHALLANDPHLQLTNPSIWFAAELDAKTHGSGKFHVAGGTFPGLPAVMIGHNETLAWGVTTAYYDLADVYEEQLTTDNQSVIFNGSPVPLLSKTFKFEDASTGTTLSKTFQWVPHHGPLVSLDPSGHKGVSIRWRGHDGGTDLDAFYGLATAATVADAKQALTNASSANQNFLVADVHGDIGWYPYAKVPARPWASPSLPPWLPLPGDGSAEWGDPVPFAMLPQLHDPPNGAIATSNNDMTGASADGDPMNDGQPAIQSWSKADGTREQRILDMLVQYGNAHTLDTFRAMQGDTYSLYGTIVVPQVLAAAQTTTLTQAEQDVIDALTVWQYTCPTGLHGNDPKNSPKSSDPAASSESIGCTAFHTVLFAIVQAALGDEAAAAGVNYTGFGVEFVARAMKDPASIASGAKFWDDITTTGTVETETDILLRALATASDVLAAIGPKDEWRWGRVHTLTLASIYDNFGISTY
ncbi:MAG TPA: penicillin acylase family protein, partial [Minicystis sp.]|nr:penicillin acylase family protein [Minicystis sp.]